MISALAVRRGCGSTVTSRSSQATLLSFLCEQCDSLLELADGLEPHWIPLLGSDKEGLVINVGVVGVLSLLGVREVIGSTAISNSSSEGTSRECCRLDRSRGGHGASQAAVREGTELSAFRGETEKGTGGKGQGKVDLRVYARGKEGQKLNVLLPFVRSFGRSVVLACVFARPPDGPEGEFDVLLCPALHSDVCD